MDRELKQSHILTTVSQYSEVLNDLVRNNFLSADFEINNEESDLFSKAKGKWLGTIIDTVEFTLSVPNKKTRNPLENNILRQLAKISGQFSSRHFALGILVQNFNRSMYFEIENRFFWNKNKPLIDRVEKDLQFWLRNINICNGILLSLQSFS